MKPNDQAGPVAPTLQYQPPEDNCARPFDALHRQAERDPSPWANSLSFIRLER